MIDDDSIVSMIAKPNVYNGQSVAGPGIFLRILLISLILTMLCALSACSFGGKPAVMVEQYALEYTPPKPSNAGPIDEAIRVERFSVAQIFNHTKMIYRQKPYSYNDYTYHRWRANPGDMVGDYLLRDLRESAIFKSVFSYRDMDTCPLILKGGVGEFYERDESDGRKAVLSLYITVMDLTRKDVPRSVIFQKNYHCEEPLVERTVQGFAQGMSRAMEKLSAQIMVDVSGAIKNRK